jgi:uncharacterized membrane protein YkvI
MADISGMGGGAGTGVPFLMGGLYVLGAVAAYCSSPQTTEINADTRADTLMKWVNFGAVQSILFIGIAATVDHQHRNALVAGGLLQLVFMYGAYLHAKESGTKNPGPRTEKH